MAGAWGFPPEKNPEGGRVDKGPYTMMPTNHLIRNKRTTPAEKAATQTVAVDANSTIRSVDVMQTG